MLAAGLGLLLGSTVHIAVAAPRRVCKQPPDDEPYSRNVSLYAAGAMASVGLGLTIAGSGGLASSYRDGAPRPSSKQRWLAAGAGFVGAAISTVIPAIAFMLEGLACAD